MSDPIIKSSDLRALKYCVSGSKRFFDRHGLGWKEFLKHGIPASRVEATGDAMALKIVQHVRERSK